MTEPQRFTVYFDGSCPLCIREISFYRRRKGADRIDWVDVSEGSFCEADLSCTKALARFHVRTRDGDLIDGGRAFAELWKQLPAFVWGGYICSLLGFGWLMDEAYNLFLPIRPCLQRLARKQSKTT